MVSTSKSQTEVAVALTFVQILFHGQTAGEEGHEAKSGERQQSLRANIIKALNVTDQNFACD